MRYLILFASLIIVCANAQNVRVYQKVYISDNDSYDSALEKGLKVAKSEALVKAGVTEYISEYTRLLTTEVNENINEVFNSDLLIHLGGSIKEWNYTVDPLKKFDSEKQLFFIEFEIKAKVKKYKSKPDPTFKAKIEGLRGSYIDGDRIEFSIFPFNESYLNIFYISESEANILFPYERAQKTLISSNKNKIIDYLLAEANTNQESGRLITVITKEYYPYDSANKNDEGYETITTVDDIFKWILDIEPENRTEYYHQFVVTK
jgi:hypothetical protein